LALQGSYLYAGGTITRYRSATANVEGIVKIKTSDGSLDPSWITGTNSGAVGTLDNVLSILSDGGYLYVAGDFTRYRSATANVGRVIKLDPADGSLVGGFGASTSDFNAMRVYALAMSPAGLVCGGDFTTYRGQTANSIAVIDPASGAFISFAASANVTGAVRSILYDNTDLVVGGSFTAVLNKPHQYLVRLHATAGTVK
jgi:hypothetical protein